MLTVTRALALECACSPETVHPQGRITPNKSIRDWTELAAGDEALASVILDRMPHRAHVLNIKGRSSRLRDLEDAFKT